MEPETHPQNLLIGKRVIYKLNRDSSHEGTVMAAELIKESPDKPVVSGYAIMLDAGTLVHIGYWRVVAVILAGNNTAPVFEKEREWGMGADKLPTDLGYINTAPPDAIDDLPF